VHADEAAAVLLVAETQERYALAVPAALAAELIAIYAHDFELDAMVRGAGCVTDRPLHGRTALSSPPRRAVPRRLAGAVITQPPQVAWPRAQRPRTARAGSVALHARLADRDLNADLRAMVGATALASRHWLFQHYDSDVQGRTLLRPGDGDAGVLVRIATARSASRSRSAAHRAGDGATPGAPVQRRCAKRCATSCARVRRRGRSRTV
jgi:phosphoribosylformylglycinamidine synthase